MFFFVDIAGRLLVASRKSFFGGEINLFADDQTVMTSKPQTFVDRTLLDELEQVQHRTHAWGLRNQVEFDPGKESMKIIHPSLGLGDDFKLLGTLFDCKLSMQPCIDKLLSKMTSMIRALLRLRHIYSVDQLIGQYKTHTFGVTRNIRVAPLY